MTTPLFNTSELRALEQDLGKVPGKVVQAVTAATLESGNGLRDAWRSNVAATGGAHLPHLPDAITTEMKFGIGAITAQVGPETSKKQGALGKGDEYGSVNTPAHMNGHKAADVVEPRFAKALDSAIGFGMGDI